MYDPANISVAEWPSLSIVLNDTATPVYVGNIIAESEGSYTVSADGLTNAPTLTMTSVKTTGCSWTLFAIWRFLCRLSHLNVVPEVPYGTVIATLSLLGATGLYVVRKRKVISVRGF